MQQMRGAVVAYRILAPLLNHTGLYSIAHAHVAFAHLAVVNNQPLERAARILYLKDAHRAGNSAPVTYLTAALSIKRRYIEHQQGLLWSADALNLCSIDDQTNHLTAAANTFVAGELAGAGTL